MYEIFPWQTPLWAFLADRYRKGCLPHAFLFEGVKGIGKTNFARAFAELLLCQEKDSTKACGQCRSCELLRSPLHPDLSIVEAEGTNPVIKIDQVRTLNEYVMKTAHFRGYRVAIIVAAHYMNRAASNALLKTLEEPPKGVVFILLTDDPSRVPATIRSRCEKIKFSQPSFDEIKSWLTKNLTLKADQNYSMEFLLRLANQSPLEALALAENDDLAWREKIIQDFSGVIFQKVNSLGLAEKYKTLRLTQLLFWLKTIVADLVQLKMGQTGRIMHTDQIELFKKIIERLNTSDLYAYLDKLYVLTNHVSQGRNLNHGLVVDEVFCIASDKLRGK